MFAIGHVDSDFQRKDPDITSYFTSPWYDSTGQALILTMLLSVFSPHVYLVYKYMRFRLRQRDVEMNKVVIFTQVGFCCSLLWVLKTELLLLYIG